MGTALGSLSKREHVVNIHLFSSNNDFANEALDDGLPLFKRELIHVRSQELSKGVCMLHDLLPMHRLVLGREELLALLGDLLQCGRHFSPPSL
jgi:hypothetical protein